MRKIIFVIMALMLCTFAVSARWSPGLEIAQNENITFDDGFVTGVGGIEFNGTAPTSTEGVLYSDGGILKFNGSDMGYMPGITVGFDAGCDFVADGTADEVTLQGAMDLAQVTGGIIYLMGGNGEYHFSATANYDLSESTVSSAEIIGIGRPRIFMDGTGPAINMSGNFTGSAALTNYPAIEHQKRPTIKGLEIRGTTAQSDGITIHKCFNPVVEDCVIYDSRYGVTLSGNNTRNVYISGNHISNCTYGVYFSGTNVHQCMITENFMQYNKRSIYGGSDSVLHNVQIVGNNLEGSDGRADSDYVLLLSDCMENDFRFSGNTVEQHGSPAGTIGVALINTSSTITPHGLIISDNTFSWIPSKAIDVDHFTGISIASNVFQACAPSSDYSIRALNTSGLVITSNAARFADWGNMGGWQITTSGHTTITGNHITLLTTPIRISSVSTGPLTMSGNTFGSATGMSTTGVLWISNGALVITSNAISAATGSAYGLVVDGTATGIVATNRASAGSSGSYSIAAGPTQANNV